MHDVFLLLCCYFRLHGLWEVTRSVHSSCDLRVPPIKVWAPKQKGGGVMVGLETGRSYFFVDPVGDNCHLGKKVTVRVFDMSEFVDWGLIVVIDSISFLDSGQCWYRG